MIARGLFSRSRRLGSNGRQSRAVGIVANEFFDPELGRMGGFGWAARRTAECLGENPELEYRALLLAGRGGIADDKRATRSNGVPLVRYDDIVTRYARGLARARVSLFLAIDFRPNYLPVLEARPETPVIVWIRDPATPDDVARMATLEIPLSTEPPAGISAIDCRAVGPLVSRKEAAGSRVVFATPAPALAAVEAPAAYGTPIPHISFLPNPLDLVPGEVTKSPRPRVVFLSRLDPIKRPWVFVELARRFPHAEFLMLGQAHFTGPGTWQPSHLPPNLRLLGHVDETAKRAVLKSAWMIVTTSIHEGLPISFLEALHCATPIVACHDPEHVTSRFGAYVGRWHGSGLEALDAFSDAIGRLLDDHDLRARLGQEGRAWVRSTHTRERFVSAFAGLAESAMRATG